MRATPEGNLPPVRPRGTWVKISAVRRDPGEPMVESSPSHQRRPPCKICRGMREHAVSVADLQVKSSQVRVHIHNGSMHRNQHIHCKKCGMNFPHKNF